MHNKLYDDMTIFTKFFTTIFIIVMFIITKSIYINLFTTLLVIYLIVINDYKLNKYFKILKNYFFINVLIFIVLGIILGFSLLYIYKFIVILLLVDIFVLQLDFVKTNTLIYRIIRSEYVSYKITLFLYYINTIFMSKDEIDNRKYGLLDCFEYAKYKRNKLDNNLKTNFYVIRKEKTNFLSIALFIFFLALLIIVIIRK